MKYLELDCLADDIFELELVYWTVIKNGMVYNLKALRATTYKVQ